MHTIVIAPLIQYTMYSAVITPKYTNNYYYFMFTKLKKKHLLNISCVPS